jgi:co-chaperonin GroES (HSP10)
MDNINYTPRNKHVLVKDSQIAGLAANSSLLLPDKLSDADRLKFGGISKSAELANKTSEEQSRYIIIKTGANVEDYKVGDEVIFMGGAQGHSIKIGEDFFLQLGEYDILGKFN